MIPPTKSGKGVAKWSLVADDNANSDDKINWAEGMLPSAVNDSARMMMTRIREQYDIDQTILKNVDGRFGNQIKAITADTWAIHSAAEDNNYNFEFHFNDKLTLEEYNAYKAGNLYLLTTLNAPGVFNDSDYKQFSYNSIIYINLYFKIGSSVHQHIMMFKLNFFGIEKTNQTISFHELKEFVNCSTLQVGSSYTSTNFVALPMKRTYMGYKDLDAPPFATLNAPPYFYRNWYFISPTECIIVDNLNFKLDANIITRGFPYIPTNDGKKQTVYLLSSFFQEGTTGVWARTDEPGKLAGSVQYTEVGAFVGTAKFLLRGAQTYFKDYPMILEPTVTNPYPLIV